MLCLCCHLPTKSNIACCHDCWQSLPVINTRHSLSAFAYQHPIDHFITQLKFHNQLHYAHWLGKWFNQRCPITHLPEAILPVPLHVERLSLRGFNQALEIAKPIARHFNLPIIRHAVQRHKKTVAQSELKPIKRRKNIKGAFSMAAPLSFSHIAILDDVITTGSTTQELSTCLAKAGVKKIEIWSLAKTK